MFLQNVLYINLNMTEQERVKRFETLKDLYQKIGYNRKAAFCQRLAAWRHISQSNTNPDWAESYRLMLESFPGHKLSLEPIEVLQTNQGWPCLQIDLIQQLVGTARRLGQSALATRHMTFLLQTMWKHLNEHERKEMALQLQSLSSQCEGAPVPLVLDNGTVIPPANLTDIPYCLSFSLKDLPPHLKPHKIVINKTDCGPFLFTPIHFNSSLDSKSSKRSKDNNQMTFLWVRSDLSEISMKLSNPLPFELQVNEMRLLTNGIVFESLPQSVVIQPNASTTVTLHGTPLEVGDLEFLGYSTHTLGVKSNCRFKNMFMRNFPPSYKINVISGLPKIDLKTSQTATFSGLTNSDNVITSANFTLYNGESQDCMVTITNTSGIAIEYLDCFLHSNFDTKIQNKLFSFDLKELQQKLPIKANESVTFKLIVYGEADFIGTVSSSTIIGSGITSATPYHDDGGPASHSGVNSIVSGLTNSLPSRVSSPVRRNNEVNSSFRSSTTHSGTLHSEHSSLAALSIVNGGGNQTRQFDAQLRFRYSGADGMVEGYCRTCAISFNVELLPSVQVYNWDVLPAEV